jgi:hypothetical protein
MTSDKALIPVERIEGIIFHLRRRKVILDSDLARIYGVSTKKLNQAVKRNIHRFPADFLFQLSRKEKQEVVTICDHLSSLKFSPHLPFAFTEHGAIMAASVLNSKRAIHVSVYVVRAFIKLREVAFRDREISRRLEDLEKGLGIHDEKINVILQALKRLMAPRERQRKKIGFQLKEKRAGYRSR